MNKLEEITEKTINKICEELPLNLTFYAKEGYCSIANKSCKYCGSNTVSNNYFCNKKTYDPSEILITT